jgi:hypothetical protein
MNINRDLKLIWWAPERCATKITAEIFRKFNFEVYNESDQTFLPLEGNYHSHNIGIPAGLEDYKIICNVRNPYDKVLSFYLNFTSVGKHFLYLKSRKTELMKKIDTFCLELFEYSINQGFSFNLEREVPVRNYVSKLSFDHILPNKLIRMENLVEDFGSLDFVRESKFWQSGEIQQMIENNNFYNKRPFSFNDLYTKDSAARVFNYYKKHFFICGYDPFSFTKEILSDDEKFQFIHKIL